MKKPYFWYSINIIKYELNIFKNKYYNLIANNGPKNDTNKSKYDNIINIINYNNVQFNNLCLRHDNNIIDFNDPIYIDDDNGVDLNIYSILGRLNYYQNIYNLNELLLNLTLIIN